MLQALVRVCCLRAFGYFISQLHTVTFTFDDAAAAFCGPQPAATSAPDQQAEQKMVRSNQAACLFILYLINYGRQHRRPFCFTSVV